MPDGLWMEIYTSLICKVLLYTGTKTCRNMQAKKQLFY
jgi:hypothetical protein